MEKKNTRWIAIVVIGLLAALCFVVGGAIASVFAYRQIVDSRKLQLSFTTEAQQPGGDLNQLAERGVVVVRVEEDSPAAVAGIRRGTIILEVNGQEVNTTAELQQAILENNAGDTITLTILNDEGEREIQATLASVGPYLGVEVVGALDMPPVTDFSEMMPFFDSPDFRAIPPREFREGTPPGGDPPAFPESFPILPEGIETAVFILSVFPDSPAEAAGIRAGDAIIELNGKQLANQDSFAEDIIQTAPGEQIELTIIRGSESHKIRATLGEKSGDPESGYLGIMMGPQLFQRGFFFEEESGE